ncbi:MAG: hypothetical protein ABF297_15190, partial [Thiogranum sp.]
MTQSRSGTCTLIEKNGFASRRTVNRRTTGCLGVFSVTHPSVNSGYDFATPGSPASGFIHPFKSIKPIDHFIK